VQGEVRVSEHRLDEPRVKRPFIPRMVRRFAIPIIFLWGFLSVTMTAFTPKVEDVAEELAGPMVPHYAPSQRALLHIGEKFHESNSTNLTMVVFSLTPFFRRVARAQLLESETVSTVYVCSSRHSNP